MRQNRGHDWKRRLLGDLRVREKIAWTLLGVLGLMFIIDSVGLDAYLQTSILSTRGKNAVVREANKLIGKGYRLGGTGPDYYDCSGFTLTVLNKALGLTDLPRASHEIYASVGRSIEKKDLGVGDLVFFDTFNYGRVSHVGIVIDTAGHFANANSYYGDVRIDDMNARYWRSAWIGARELTEADGLDQRDREPVRLASEDELKESVYDEVGFPPSEFADPRLNPDVFAAAQIVPDNEIITSSEPVISGTAQSEHDADLNAPGQETVGAIVPIENETAPPEQYYSDIPVGHPLYEATKLLREYGIARGYDDGSFSPDRAVSRIELLKMAFETFDIAPASGGDGFPDVSAAHWGQGYVRAAVEREIVSGYPDGEFRPDRVVNRVEALKILFRAGSIQTEIYEDGMYEDVSASDWFAPFVQSALRRGLIEYHGSSFMPERGMTRGEVALFIYRLLQPQT